MKNLLSFFAIVIAFSLQAQNTVTTNDFPVPGTNYVVSHTASIDSNLYIASGASQTWDFSGMIPASQDTVSFLDPMASSIPTTYRVAFNNPLDPDHQATVAATMETDQGMPMVTITDVYNFYKLTSSQWIQVGMGANVNGSPIPVLWDPTEVILNLPANYGDQDTSYSAYDMSVPNVGYYGEDRMRVNEINGFGTLITPYGTFDALKVTTVIYIHDSIYMDSLGFGMPMDRVETEYKWFANGYQIPVMQVLKRTGMGAGVTITYIDSLRNLSVNEMLLNQIYTFPNPVENNLFLDIPSGFFPLTAEIYDQQGRLVLQTEILDPEINVSALNSGFYSIRLRNDEEVFVSKFLKR